MKNSILYSIFLLVVFIKTYAHENRPVSVNISQSADNKITIKYVIPNSISVLDLPKIRFSKTRRSENKQPVVKELNNSYIVEEVFDGKIGALKNQEILIDYPNGNPTLTTIVQLFYKKESPQIIVMSPTENSIDLSEKKAANSSSFSFIGLGVQHIFKGYDHLLFIVCLFIICGFSSKLLWAITGFTIAHSITLFLTVYKIANIPVAYIEVLITLSIVFLCTEILKKGKKTTLTQRFPIFVTTIFGLIHGIGFAAVLNEIEIPKSNLLLSLLNFNIGVEIGQLFFLGMFISIVFIVKRITFLNTNAGLKYLTYSIGSIAAFWTIERILSWY